MVEPLFSLENMSDTLNLQKHPHGKLHGPVVQDRDMTQDRDMSA